MFALACHLIALWTVSGGETGDTNASSIKPLTRSKELTGGQSFLAILLQVL
jgi:hypothetical protein